MQSEPNIIWSVSSVFLGTLGRGDIDPVMGKHLPCWYPWGPTFQDTAFSTVLVETEPAILRLTSQPSLGIFSVLVVLNSVQRFHPVWIGARLACCFLAYVPVKPNMFSVSDPSNIMSFLSRLWIHEPTLVLRAKKNSTINFQECLGAWVRQSMSCGFAVRDGWLAKVLRLKASLF